MRYLLDTNICIAFLHKDDANIKSQFKAHDPTDLLLCSIVKGELLYGARKSQAVEKNMLKLRRFFSFFESFHFDDKAAEYYGFIHATLSKSGNLIGLNDILIASIALAEDVTIVTRNTKEFIRVPGLRLEEW